MVAGATDEFEMGNGIGMRTLMEMHFCRLVGIWILNWFEVNFKCGSDDWIMCWSD
jgi:hypothetical protein